MPIIRRIADFFKKIITSMSEAASSSEVSKKGMKRSQPWWRDSEKKKKKKKPHLQSHAFSENLNKPRKVAMFIGYSGKGYHGIQLQRDNNVRTIESDLFKALIQVGLIESEHVEDLKQMQFQRASRTDKGVSAVGNVVSLKMLLNVEDLVTKVNEALPEQIRVYGYVRTTKGFDCKRMCTGRTYIYILPTMAFAPMEEIITPEYRVTDKIIGEVNRILQRFQGTHNFHNYTSQIKPNDPSAKRYIVSAKCSEPFVTDRMEFAQITFDGQSFMMHQIRKMIGITIAIVKGHYNEDALDKSWGPEKLDIPKAPGLGLILESLHFRGYNQSYSSDGIHEPITWEPYKEAIESFKEKYIIPEILKTEKEEQNMMDWLAYLINHSDDINSMERESGAFSRAKIEIMGKALGTSGVFSATTTQDEATNIIKNEKDMVETESCEMDKANIGEMDMKEETERCEMDKREETERCEMGKREETERCEMDKREETERCEMDKANIGEMDMKEETERCEMDKRKETERCEMDKREDTKNCEIDKRAETERCEMDKRKETEICEMDKRKETERCEMDKREDTKNCEMDNRAETERCEMDKREDTKNCEMDNRAETERCEMDKREETKNCEMDKANIGEMDKREEAERCEMDKANIGEIDMNTNREKFEKHQNVGHSDHIPLVSDNEKDNVTVSVLDNSGDNSDVCKDGITEVYSQKVDTDTEIVNNRASSSQT